MSQRDIVERWSGLRLWVYRTRQGKAPCALILRTVEGRGQREQLLARGQIDCAPGSEASIDPLAALVASLVDLYGPQRVSQALALHLTGNAGPAPLEGPQGG